MYLGAEVPIVSTLRIFFSGEESHSKTSSIIQYFTFARTIHYHNNKTGWAQYGTMQYMRLGARLNTYFYYTVSRSSARRGISGRNIVHVVREENGYLRAKRFCHCFYQ